MHTYIHTHACMYDITFVYTLKACGNMGAIEKGLELHFDVLCKGLEKDSFIGSTLVDMYAKCGLVSNAKKAQAVFNRLPSKDVIMWNVALKSRLWNNLEALMCCCEAMQHEGDHPNVVT